MLQLVVDHVERGHSWPSVTAGLAQPITEAGPARPQGLPGAEARLQQPAHAAGAVPGRPAGTATAGLQQQHQRYRWASHHLATGGSGINPLLQTVTCSSHAHKQSVLQSADCHNRAERDTSYASRVSCSPVLCCPSPLYSTLSEGALMSGPAGDAEASAGLPTLVLKLLGCIGDEVMTCEPQSTSCLLCDDLPGFLLRPQ